MTQSTSGSRLAYVVVKLDGKVMREQTKMVPTRTKVSNGDQRTMWNMKRELVEEDAGYMVYFPRGHAIRLKSKNELAMYNLDKDPPIINIEGLQDPNSPLGKLIFSQDDAARREAFVDLRKNGIELACIKSGKVLMPEQLAQVA